MMAEGDPSLRGSLKAFGMHGVLQLLAQQQKTGKLLLEGETRNMTVVFEKGRVVSAWVGNAKPSSGLIERLLRGVLPETLERIQASATTSGGSVARVMVDLGLVDVEELEEICSQLVVERIVTAFFWKDGNYSFTAEQKPYGGLRVAPLEVDAILFRAALMQDELPRIREVFPDNDVLVSPPPAEPPDAEAPPPTRTTRDCSNACPGSRPP